MPDQQRDARDGERWLTGTVALLFVAAITLLHLYSPEQVSVLADSIVHSLHAPGFAAVGLAILLYLQRQHRRPLNYLRAGVLAMAIGVIAEASQIPGPREAQFQDLVTDAVGVFGALGVAALYDRDLRRTFGRFRVTLLAVAGGTALVLALWPTLWLSYAMLARNSAFPTLVTFEHRWETNIVGREEDRQPELVAAPAYWPDLGDTVALGKEEGRWGILLRLYPYPDWSDYASVSFVAASSSEVVHKVSFAIRDIRRDRDAYISTFYKQLRIGPEPVRFSIAFEELRDARNGRPLDLRHVDTIILSASKPGSGVELLIDDFRLD